MFFLSDWIFFEDRGYVFIFVFLVVIFLLYRDIRLYIRYVFFVKWKKKGMKFNVFFNMFCNYLSFKIDF